MPTGNNIVETTTTTDLGTSAVDGDDIPCVIDAMAQADLPSVIEYNQTLMYSDPATVATDFGEGSDLHIEAQAVAQDYDVFYVMVLEMTEETEMVGDSAGTATSKGALSNAPVTGQGSVTIKVNGTEVSNVIDVTTSPPKMLDGSSPSNDNAVINRDTAELETATASDPTVTNPGIEVTYNTVSWAKGLQTLVSNSVDLVCLANQDLSRATIGDIDELQGWADSNDITLGGELRRGSDIGDIPAEQQHAVDVISYTPGRLFYPLVNDSTDALAGRIIGRLAANGPGHNLYMDELSGVNTGSQPYTKANVGYPGLHGTFEGGDKNGMGMANVLHDDGAPTLSNGLSAAGEESSYRFLDIGRREAAAKARARDAVKREFKSDSGVTFAFGADQIKEAILDSLDSMTTSTDGEAPMFRELEVNVPEGAEVSEQARLNRLWEGITLKLVPTIPAHRAKVEIYTTLA